MNALHPKALVCLRATELLATVASALLSAQALSGHGFLATHGMAAWRGHPHPRMARLLNASGLGFLFTYPATISLLCLRMLSGSFVLGCILSGHSPRLPLLALVVLTSLWHLRLPISIEGSSQFSYHILIAATVAEFLSSQSATAIALIFIAAQAALAYATAGFLKLKEKGWRDGTHLCYVLSTAAFGDADVARFYGRHPELARLSSILFVLLECLLPFAVLLPPPACAILLCCGVLMHAGIARVLGLNTFLWAFTASYPAIFFLSTQLYGI